MDILFSGSSLVEVEPYLIGFAAGIVCQRFYVFNKWRFAAKSK